jgi:uncharacterized protein (DUF169 family)
MIDLKAVNDTLIEYVKLMEFPVAVKMLPDFNIEKLRQEHPKAKIPHLDLGMRVITCQAMAMARKYEWELILNQEDLICPTGLVVMGFAKMLDSMLSGEDPVAPFNQSREARARRIRTLPRFNHGDYKAMLIAPLHRASFEPDAVVVYGSSAQVMRLVQAALFFEGGSLSSSCGGGQGCSQYITKTIMDKQCRYILPGNGDRIFGLVDDGQMIFSMPKERVESVTAGLRESHIGGQRLPIPSYLKFEVQMPEKYQALTEKLLKDHPS